MVFRRASNPVSLFTDLPEPGKYHKGEIVFVRADAYEYIDRFSLRLNMTPSRLNEYIGLCTERLRRDEDLALPSVLKEQSQVQ